MDEYDDEISFHGIGWSLYGGFGVNTFDSLAPDSPEWFSIRDQWKTIKALCVDQEECRGVALRFLKDQRNPLNEKTMRRLVAECHFPEAVAKEYLMSGARRCTECERVGCSGKDYRLISLGETKPRFICHECADVVKARVVAGELLPPQKPISLLSKARRSKIFIGCFVLVVLVIVVGNSVFHWWDWA